MLTGIVTTTKRYLRKNSFNKLKFPLTFSIILNSQLNDNNLRWLTRTYFCHNFKCYYAFCSLFKYANNKDPLKVKNPTRIMKKYFQRNETRLFI